MLEAVIGLMDHKITNHQDTFCLQRDSVVMAGNYTVVSEIDELGGGGILPQPGVGRNASGQFHVPQTHCKLH